MPEVQHKNGPDIVDNFVSLCDEKNQIVGFNLDDVIFFVNVGKYDGKDQTRIRPLTTVFLNYSGMSIYNLQLSMSEFRAQFNKAVIRLKAFEDKDALFEEIGIPLERVGPFTRSDDEEFTKLQIKAFGTDLKKDTCFKVKEKPAEIIRQIRSASEKLTFG